MPSGSAAQNAYARTIRLRRDLAKRQQSLTQTTQDTDEAQDRDDEPAPDQTSLDASPYLQRQNPSETIMNARPFLRNQNPSVRANNPSTNSRESAPPQQRSATQAADKSQDTSPTATSRPTPTAPRPSAHPGMRRENTQGDPSATIMDASPHLRGGAGVNRSRSNATRNTPLPERPTGATAQSAQKTQNRQDEKRLGRDLQSAQRREKFDRRNPLQAIDTATSAGSRVATGLILKWAWGALIPSFGLTIIYLDFHFFMAHFVKNPKFIKLGREWFLKGGGLRPEGTSENSMLESGGAWVIGWIEIAVLLTINFLLLAIFAVLVIVAIMMLREVVEELGWVSQLLLPIGEWFGIVPEGTSQAVNAINDFSGTSGISLPLPNSPIHDVPGNQFNIPGLGPSQ